MAHRIGRWVALALVALGASCADGGEPACSEEAADCEEGAPDIRGSEQPLTLPHLPLFVSIQGTAPAGGGTVAASSRDPRARCRGSHCVALRGATVTLTATPSEGVLFSRWSGCSESTNPVLSLPRVRESLRCMAEFVVRVAGTASADASPKPVPLLITAEGARREADGVWLVPYGADVTFSIPDAKAYTGVWSGCVAEQRGASITLEHVTKMTVCRAALEPQVEVSWRVEPEGAASVRGEPASQCDATHCRVRLYGTVTLEATPREGYRFVRWRGCSDATTPRISQTFAASGECVAELAPAGRFDAIVAPGESHASDVSDDGLVVVGTLDREDRAQAFRWTKETGMTTLAAVPSRALGVSPDGHYAVGAASAESGGGAAIWKLGAAPEILTGVRQVGPVPAYAQVAVAVRNDGRVYMNCYPQYPNPGGHQTFGCQRDAAGAYDLVYGVSAVFAGDDDGTGVGTQYPDGRYYQGPYASAAMLGSTRLPYPSSGLCSVSNRCSAEARALTPDHAVVVGTALLPPPGMLSTPLLPTAFAYRASTQVSERLADLPGAEEATSAFDVSADGRVIAGFGTAEDGEHAVVWVDGQPRRLDALAREAGTPLSPDFRLLRIVAMSSDAKVFVGEGRTAAGTACAYRIALPAAP